MGKVILYLMILLLIPVCVLADQSDIEKATQIGESINRYLENQETYNYEEELRVLQEVNGEEAVKVGLKQVLIEQQKNWIIIQTSLVWEHIGSLFIMFFHILKMFIFVLEMWFASMILFRVIPGIFIKIKETIEKWYLKSF